MSAKISILIVTLNAAEVLQACLNSIWKQTYPFLETIVIDGGSRDGTVDILQKNKDKISYWTSEKDEGIYDAMNKGLGHINGDFVYFLGADDILLDDFSLFASEIQSSNTIYYGSVLKNGEKYLGQMSPYQIAKTNINHQAMIYPVSVFERYQFDTSYPISADHVLNMRCFRDRDFKFAFLDYVIAIFNDQGISSLNKDGKFEQEKGGLILRNFGLSIWLRFWFKQLKAKLVG